VTNNGCERAAVQEASDITKFFKKNWMTGVDRS